jgi:hypothetical protein
MVPSPQKVIVMLGDQVSAVCPTLDTISGVINYTAVVASECLS